MSERNLIGYAVMVARRQNEEDEGSCQDIRISVYEKSRSVLDDVSIIGRCTGDIFRVFRGSAFALSARFSQVRARCTSPPVPKSVDESRRWRYQSETPRLLPHEAVRDASSLFASSDLHQQAGSLGAGYMLFADANGQ